MAEHPPDRKASEKFHRPAYQAEKLIEAQGRVASLAFGGDAGLAAGGAATRIWAHGNLDAARATAAALGLTAVRELWQMRRSLSDLPPLLGEPGVRLTTYPGPEVDAELLANVALHRAHQRDDGREVRHRVIGDAAHHQRVEDLDRRRAVEQRQPIRRPCR